ncbi:MAG: class I tRNA ligase family protein [Patescibacteria group bacterium]
MEENQEKNKPASAQGSGEAKKSDAALREEAVLEFWKENKIFEKSLTKKAPKGNYVFYDGPPFATGLMHYGHILGSTAKDVVGRYQTMKGFHVPRKWGWDCHGLPIENIVEKDLNIAGHKEIEKFGIDKFVEHARSKVLQYDKEWEKSVERIGRWVDFKGGYKTMDNTFIESAWWAFSQLNKKGLIYEGVRVLAYCARCETPIANSEIAMDNSYKDIADISIYVKFELEDEPRTYLLAWTTTPWTLPGNTAIAINKNIVYVKVKIGDDVLILAKETLNNVIKNKEYSMLGEVRGADLIGKKYKPVFPYYQNTDMPNRENIWKIWHADFVTTEKGTGIAHEAPAFGEEDADLAKANSIPWIIHVDETGRFKAEVVDFAGLKVKPKDTLEDKDAHLRSDIEVIKYLQKTGAYFDKEKIIHSYPHCMRCETPIIYYALPSWFINIQKVKKQIIKKADAMNWVPAHLKEGRFKNIVENAPDWNVSRNRYWASPLPVWKCEKCAEKIFIGSMSELKEKTKKSGNKYFVMRHGESESNIKHGSHGVISSREENVDHLTEVGRGQVEKTAKELKNKKIDLVFASPLMRTRETLAILKEKLGLTEEQIVFDKRLQEIQGGSFEGKPWDAYLRTLLDPKERFLKSHEGVESLLEVKKRVGNVIYELEEKYSEKNILIISHGGPLWMFYSVLHGYNVDESIAMTGGLFRHSEEIEKGVSGSFRFFKNAECRAFDFISIPHNEKYELDYHRPYIDSIKLVCDCSAMMNRVPEVLDCWFESGSMPFAQDHYPFKNPKWQKNNFPAGFVAEYIAQTRTWFYYTHVLSTILFNHAPFENVVTTGTLLAEDGQKISKSKKNYPDPWIFIDKYGVDALRIYLMTSPLMKGEDANFSEKSVQEISSKIIGRLGNVFSFYELYRDHSLEAITDNPKPNTVLDQWILARLNQFVGEVTNGMEAYDMNEASRPIENFIEDLSVWYLRRSRDRIKNGDKEAKQTLYFVLKTLAKTMAPFAPFTAEDIWLKLKNEDSAESVHLENWPKAENINSKIIEEMDMVRKVVTLGLEARQKAGIKVRQPLAKLEVKDLNFGREYVELIKDELNVKVVVKNINLETEVALDTTIIEELKQEGDYRELVRAIQDMRKNMGLTPSDVISLCVETSGEGKKLVRKFENDMKKTVLASKVEFQNNDGQEVKVDTLVFKVKIEK